MPLHLLGKKSWNVYNPENISRVRRDEAAARAHEEAAEQRMQEEDAERRIRILRGKAVSPPREPAPPPDNDCSHQPQRRVDKEGEGGGRYRRERKRRRIAGEDDTEREMRYAREDAVTAHEARRGKELQLVQKRKGGEGGDEAPLMDQRGHINLFPVDEGKEQKKKRNRDADAEKKKIEKEKENAEQYTMRFDNAAGFKKSVGETPWYYFLDAAKAEGVHAPGTDVWGNEDLGRKERERGRVERDDPLRVIQRGVNGVREVERERRRWREEKRGEIEGLAEDEERRRRKRRRERRRREEEGVGVEGFSLDGGDRGEGKRMRRASRADGERKRSLERDGRYRNRDRDRHRHGREV